MNLVVRINRPGHIWSRRIITIPAPVVIEDIVDVVPRRRCLAAKFAKMMVHLVIRDAVKSVQH